jgi:DNA processing protein
MKSGAKIERLRKAGAMSLSAELRSMLTLQLVPGLGPRLTAALLDHFGSAQAVVQTSATQLATVPHIGEKLADDLHRAMRQVDVQKEMELVERFQTQLLPAGTDSYPPSLNQIPDPPPLLYMRGQWTQRDSNAVALVGSRQCTAYGRRVAERFAEGLVRAGYTVISGLARGIDGAAHRGALRAGGRTIAVLAGGLSKIYPPEHAELAQEVQNSGALLSESSMAMGPLAVMFPARNRLISGLSRAVVVVEAAEHSGALITARHAGDQGKTVFAVPGPIDSAASSGTHHLLRQGAILTRGVEDIVEDLEGVSHSQMPTRPSTPTDLNSTQQQIWDFLEEQPRHIDEMARQLQVNIPDLSQALMYLEMKKIIRRLPGNLYERA